jgi:hypothetical protein
MLEDSGLVTCFYYSIEGALRQTIFEMACRTLLKGDLFLIFTIIEVEAHVLKI